MRKDRCVPLGTSVRLNGQTVGTEQIWKISLKTIVMSSLFRPDSVVISEYTVFLLWFSVSASLGKCEIQHDLMFNDLRRAVFGQMKNNTFVFFVLCVSHIMGCMHYCRR